MDFEKTGLNIIKTFTFRCYNKPMYKMYLQGYMMPLPDDHRLFSINI